MGHDGPGHIAISDGRPVLRGLGVYHGNRGHGVSVEFNVKTGPITILGMTQTAEGRLKMLAAEASRSPARGWRSATPTPGPSLALIPPSS